MPIAFAILAYFGLEVMEVELWFRSVTCNAVVGIGKSVSIFQRQRGNQLYIFITMAEIEEFTCSTKKLSVEEQRCLQQQDSRLVTPYKASMLERDAKKDYGVYDMAQLRFKAGHKISENLYMRQDGTRSYYFSVEFLTNVFNEDDVAQGGNRPRPEHSRPGVVLVGDLDLKKKVTDCHKPVWKRKDGLEEDVKTLKNQVDIEKGKLKVCKSQLGLKEEELNESKVAVENKVAKVNELEENLLQKQTELQEIIVKLKEGSDQSNNTRKQILDQKITEFA
ncbi:hypothetical protein MTP99_014392 [Tenebrio molitor]|nr:hypothetical protein MTP99_014392 [Tenebrio molitor]